ncbi:GIP, partial [Symbiodinium necroappetens]
LYYKIWLALQMNPNSYDDGDEQVMSPNVTGDPGMRRTVTPTPIVNGVDPPPGGHLDMDGEVTGPRVESTSPSISARPAHSTAGVVGRESRAATAAAPKAPRLRIVLEYTPNHWDQPLVALVIMRWNRGNLEQVTVPGTPLFDMHTMERLQQLHAAAPQSLMRFPPLTLLADGLRGSLLRVKSKAQCLHRLGEEQPVRGVYGDGAIKPGVNTLPDLPLPGILVEAGEWYSNYLRIETMILAALPQAVKQEVKVKGVEFAEAQISRRSIGAQDTVYFLHIPAGVKEGEAKGKGKGGDSREEWYRTKGGTLVVPPTVHHPHLGLLKTGVGRNTCPFIQEDQALSLISQLEDRRLSEFKEQVQELEVHMESVSAPVDPTEALRRYAITGGRSEALRAIFAQPYFDGVDESLKARLAEDLVGLDEDSGKRMLKQLPVNRAHRRSLLASERTWCQDRDMQLVEVDVISKGGKGWDLMKSDGVWRVERVRSRSRRTQVCTNLDLSCMCALEGRYTGPSCEELDQVIARALKRLPIFPFQMKFHNQTQRYGLVGAFRVPKSAIQHSKAASKEAGIEDLFGVEQERNNDPVEDLAEYQPSELGRVSTNSLVAFSSKVGSTGCRSTDPWKMGEVVNPIEYDEL